jgi:putative ABC transport system ATP-binding protein
VLDLFDELHGDGLTLVVITHDPAVSARAQRRIRISDGTLTEIA